MRFLVISLRRSGSSHFVGMIGGHPEIMCHGNIFVSGMLPVHWPKNHPLPSHEIALIRTGLRELRKSDPRAFMERVFATNHGRPHVGFKIFTRQNDEILEELIDDPSIRKILLVRGNILARFSSQMIAHETGSWGVRAKLEAEIPKVEFDPQRFSRYCAAHTQFYTRVLDRLLEKRQIFHLVRYEEINDPLLLRSVVNFIGADPSLPIVETDRGEVQVKQNSPDIVSRFSNVDVVREYLAIHNRLGWAYEGEGRVSSALDDTAARAAEIIDLEPRETSPHGREQQDDEDHAEY